MTKGLHRVRSVNSGFVIGGKNFRAVATGAFLVLFALNMAVVFPPHTKQTVDAATGTATDSVITYVGVNDTASVSLGITSPLGTFATSTDGTNNTTDQRAKFTISTNNYTGYSVSMTSSSATNTLVDSNNDDTNTNNISSIPSAVVDTVFAADTEAGQALNNKWGFKPSYYESNANTDTFYPMLTSSDNVLIRKTTIANSANGIDNADEYTLSLGLRVNFATKQGTYTNDAFIVEYVANPITYSITYADNTGDSTVANLPYESATPPHVQTDMTDGTSVILSDIVPTRTGYDFTGWCNEAPTVTEGTSSCAGTVYNPNGAGADLTYGIDKTSTNEATIYAMWAPKTYAVTVDFAGTGIESVTLTNTTYDDATITTSGDTANLKYDVTYNIEATLIAGNYVFEGWTYGDNAVIGSVTDNPTSYSITGTSTLTATANEVNVITFQAGDNINTIIVADGSNKYRPYYATSGAPAVFTNPTPGTKYLVTVIPEANNILSGWAGDTTELDSTTLLTTTYTVPDASATLTATGTAGTYSSMKDFALSSCTAATNLTDARDGKSYTVAPFVNGNTTYCYMLSNLRLDSGTTLTSTDSDINPNGATYTDPTTSESVTATTFTTPTEAWTSSAQDYYCKAIMKTINNEYYYNWYAAKANPYPCANPTSSTNATAENDAYSLGSICPAGWTLPDYSTDITAAMLWSSGANPGILATTGRFSSGFQHYVGDYGFWWSSARYDNYSAYRLYFNGTGASRDSVVKSIGYSVRCLRSS